MTTARASRTDNPAGSDAPPVNRTLIYISLALALLLVGGVLVGSKLVVQQLNNRPVALSELPSPMADSPECAALIDALPTTLLGHDRARLVEPAPPGAAVWQSSSTERITLRCGVDMPLQYSELTPTLQAAGATWIKVADPAGADSGELATWFSVDRSPVVAVTADSVALGSHADPLSGLDLSALPQTPMNPAPAPLADLADLADLTDASGAAAADCRGLMSALPEAIGSGYGRIDLNGVRGLEPDTAAAWGGDGREPVVVKCGVAPPPSYAPGAQLTQINGVPWFEESAAASPTATTLYALGRSTDIAVSLPASVGEGALAELSDLIAANVPEQS